MKSVMKKYLVCCLILIGIAACSTRDHRELPNDILTDKTLIGNWKLDNYKVSGVTKGYYRGFQFEGTVSSFGKNYQMFFTFHHDHRLELKGRFTMVTTSTTNNITQKLERDVQIINGFSNQATWEIQSNSIYIHSKEGIYEIPYTLHESGEVELNFPIHQINDVNHIEVRTQGIQTVELVKIGAY